MQGGALVGQPLLAADLDVFAASFAALFFGVPKCAEFLVQTDLVTQLAEYDFCVNRVVQKSDPRDVIRNQVLGVAQVGKRAENVAPLVFGQLPLLVVNHVDDDVESGYAFADELRQLIGAGFLDEPAGRLFDLFGGPVVLHGNTGFVDDGLKASQVVVAERESNIERHCCCPCLSVYPKGLAPNSNHCCNWNQGLTSALPKRLRTI